MPPETLPERMLDGQSAEPLDHLLVMTQGELGLEQPLDPSSVDLLQTRGLHTSLIHVGEVGKG